MQVAQTGHVGLLLELLLAGANPDLADPACGLTVLHDASRDGFVDSVKTLLENGADANKVDSSGNLPLHLAAKEGHLDVVQLLIWRTANPRQRNKQGATAFQLASSTGKAKTARYLQEYRPRESPFFWFVFK